MTAEAEQTLVEVRRLRARTRSRAHAGAWLPVAVIAAPVLSSIALYRQPFTQPQELAVASPFWAGLPDEQYSPLLSPLLVIAVALVAVGWAERSAAVALAGGWVAVITARQTASGRIGYI